jgi:CHAD domain-containing protein
VAKARPIPGVGKDDAFAVVAARVVEIRTRELVEHSTGVLDLGDIERLHDMRVATRRLRSALEVFRPCFPKKRYREVHREVKELADVLGERRDRDVTLEFLDDFATGLGASDRPGVRSLAAAVRDEQAQANLRVAPAVTPERVAALERQLLELVAEAAAVVEPEVAEPEPAAAEPQLAPEPAEPEPQPAAVEVAPEAETEHEREPRFPPEPAPPPSPPAEPSTAGTNGGDPH